MSEALVRSIVLRPDQVVDLDRYPFSVPAIRQLENELLLDAAVTLFTGENGTGKSTLIEAVAVAAGFNAEGGSRNMSFSTRRSHSLLHRNLRLVRGVRRPRTGYFLRAESFFNVATYIEHIPDAVSSHGGRPLHDQSHGESFLSLVTHRFGANGLYVLDEPEAALSIRGELALMRRMYDLIGQGSQFIIATHSPIILGFPEATIYLLSDVGIARIAYEEAEAVALTRSFLRDRESFFRHLFAD